LYGRYAASQLVSRAHVAAWRPFRNHILGANAALGVHPKSNVLLDCEVWKEAVILRDVGKTTLLWRGVDAGHRVEPDLVAEPNETFLRAIQTGRAAQDRGLA
jgi:hypothetical protein